MRAPLAALGRRCLCAVRAPLGRRSSTPCAAPFSPVHVRRSDAAFCLPCRQLVEPPAAPRVAIPTRHLLPLRGLGAVGHLLAEHLGASPDAASRAPPSIVLARLGPVSIAFCGERSRLPEAWVVLSGLGFRRTVALSIGILAGERVPSRVGRAQPYRPGPPKSASSLTFEPGAIDTNI